MNLKLNSSKNGLTESFEKLPENFFEALDQSEILNKSHDYSTDRTKGLNESYDPIVDGPVFLPIKPSLIPSLDFNKLDEYNKKVKIAKQKHQEENLKEGGSGDEIDELESILNSKYIDLT
jgi:hypothetical protein